MVPKPNRAMIKEERHTARKRHRCAVCRKPIEPGDEYIRYTHKDDDREFHHVKKCVGRPCLPGVPIIEPIID